MNLAENYKRFFKEELSYPTNLAEADGQEMQGTIAFEHMDYMAEVPAEILNVLPNKAAVESLMSDINSGEEEPESDDPMLFDYDAALKDGITEWLLSTYGLAVEDSMSDDKNIDMIFSGTLTQDQIDELDAFDSIYGIEPIEAV